MLAAQMEEPPLWRHFGGMYFDQALLLLYVRISLFRFSLKLNGISEASLDSRQEVDSREQWTMKFQALRWHFALFANLYQFPLLSNQQQGLEMYTLARKHMDIDAFFDEIQKEIEGRHEYLAIEEAQKTAVLAQKNRRQGWAAYRGCHIRCLLFADICLF